MTIYNNNDNDNDTTTTNNDNINNNLLTKRITNIMLNAHKT